MKLKRSSTWRVVALFIAGCGALLTLEPVAYAQGLGTGPAYNASPILGPLPSYDLRFSGVTNATANQTFATTSYADLAGTAITFVPTVNDPTQMASSYVMVSFELQGSKATATTGTCGVFINGAVSATTTATINVAGVDESFGGVYLVPNTTVGSQTVKVQCKSGDTNVFTVAKGQLVVWDYYKTVNTNP